MLGRFLTNSNRKRLCTAHRHDNNDIHVHEVYMVDVWTNYLVATIVNPYPFTFTHKFHPLTPQKNIASRYEERREFGTMKKKMIQL